MIGLMRADLTNRKPGGAESGGPSASADDVVDAEVVDDDREAK